MKQAMFILIVLVLLGCKTLVWEYDEGPERSADGKPRLFGKMDFCCDESYKHYNKPESSVFKVFGNMAYTQIYYTPPSDSVTLIEMLVDNHRENKFLKDSAIANTYWVYYLIEGFGGISSSDSMSLIVKSDTNLYTYSYESPKNLTPDKSFTLEISSNFKGSISGNELTLSDTPSSDSTFNLTIDRGIQNLGFVVNPKLILKTSNPKFQSTSMIVNAIEIASNVRIGRFNEDYNNWADGDSLTIELQINQFLSYDTTLIIRR